MTPIKKLKKNDLYIDHFRRSAIGRESTPMKSSGKSSIRESLVSFVDDTLSSMFRS